MGKLSRTKGTTFERLICQLVRACDPTADVRRGKQSHLADEPDVVITSGAGMLPDLWIECHHGAESIASKMNQALMDSGDSHRMPIVVWRRTGSRAINATIHVDDLAVLCGFVTVETLQAEGYSRGATFATVEAGDLFALARDAKRREARERRAA